MSIDAIRLLSSCMD